MGRAEATGTKSVDVKARASRAAQLYFDKNSLSSQLPRFTCPGCLAAQRRVEEGLAPENARRARTVADLVAVDDRRRDCSSLRAKVDIIRSPSQQEHPPPQLKISAA